MNEFTAWHRDTMGTKVVEALAKNNFRATYCQTGQEAVTQVLNMIPNAATIGVGGSWTINELGVLDTLAVQGHTIFNHNKPGLSDEEKLTIRRAQLTCDVFLTSTNAVTMDGRLVNTDGIGNRVAAMIFGPKKVILIAGINKIVRDVAEAEKRIKSVAAPINNKRMNYPNPCIKTGECMDCQSPTRICNATTILNKRPRLSDIHIFIVGEELGF
ncbi:MAG: lactate utilization protein [Negativicutes bacterium]|nr:lactate utilization protein [Negativicutes bacterium]